MQSARALWITQSGKAACQETPLNADAGHVPVRTLFTGISRGTERLVFNGQVPKGEHATMRAPYQDGDFTFPVKYGYAAVGEIQDGTGDTVFALFPHQTYFALPRAACVPVPDNVPADRAILAANMETALNILWDARISPGDRVRIVGCGVVGALAGYLAARMPGNDVCMIDIDPLRASLATNLGCTFATPDTAIGNADVVIHASATSRGLNTAIALAGTEATVVEASWFGTKDTNLALGGAFHQKRLRLQSTQVGRIPAHQAARWTYRRRMEKALSLLADPALDVLISGETAFDDLAAEYGGILNDPATLCHRVRYAP